VTDSPKSSQRDAPVTTTAERYVMNDSRAARLVAMEGELLLYTNPVGHAPGRDDSVLGLYYRDTRHLSRIELLLGGRQPVVLTSSADRGYSETVELTNLELRAADGRVVPQAVVHVRRTRVVADKLYELLRVRNYDRLPVDIALDLHFDADFADLFEVRGVRRRRRGRLRPPEATGTTLTFAYEGLDDVVRTTVVTFTDPPTSLRGGRARYRLRLAPGERLLLRYDVAVAPDPPPPLAAAHTASDADLNQALGAVRRDHERWAAESTDIFTDNEQLTTVLRRAQEDLRVLTMAAEDGRVTLAGVPWFSAPCGRAMLTVGLETLLLDLRFARSGVRYLARRQGRVNSAFRDEQPGKIMHELRRGELANLRAIPHTPYFGAIDTTPLWLLTLCELTMWTGDLEGFDLLHQAVEAAVKWLGIDGDADGDGFVEYERRSRAGLLNQGWRDSGDAIVHADGSLARGPIALAEVQGYVYYAKRRLAAIYGQLGDVERAERMAQDARELKRRFNERFWMEDEQFFAMALDGGKRQVKTVCSTIGHCLWSRIVADEHVDAVAKRLLAPDMFSGWGVRTVSKSSVAYNPMSFYNGGVWPYDTAIAANGLKKHGYAQESNRIALGLFEAALAYERTRLPELFCGFSRQSSPRPVSFPMACWPHASASGALFLVLQSMLGIYAQADENVVYVHDPVLPKWIGEVGLRNLHIGRTTMDLVFRRSGSETGFSVRDKKGPGRIVVVE
jgi:glycogen debranching enzyme